MRLSLALTCKSLGLGGQGYDGEVDFTGQWSTERMNICSIKLTVAGIWTKWRVCMRLVILTG